MRVWCIWFYLFVSPFYLYAQSFSETGELKWDENFAITVDDFKMTSPGRNTILKSGKQHVLKLEGFIYTGIKFSCESKGAEIVYEVYSFMMPERSWLSDKENREILIHEQAHFNITEVFTRKLKHRLSRIHDTQKARKAYLQILKELEKKQKQFDEEHLGEAGVSEKWEKWILAQLKMGKAYKEMIVVPE